MKSALTMFVLSLATVCALAGCKKKEEKAAEPAAGSAVGSAADTGSAPGSAADTAAKPVDTAGGGAMAGMSVDAACDKMIGVMTSMATAVESNKGKCDAMGDALEKWVTENKEIMTWAQDTDAAKKKEFEEKCGPKMTPAMEKIGPMMAGVAECAENAKVKAAMSSME
jgi:hypothetical protein